MWLKNILYNMLDYYQVMEGFRIHLSVLGCFNVVRKCSPLVPNNRLQQDCLMMRVSLLVLLLLFHVCLLTLEELKWPMLMDGDSSALCNNFDV